MAKVIKSVDMPAERVEIGKMIFGEGTMSPHFYILRSGRVGIYRNYGTPDEIHLATIEPGSVFGEISAIDGLPRTASAVGIEEGDVVKIARTALLGQLDQCPQWFKAVVLEIVERLRMTDEMLAHANAPHLHSTGKASHSSEE